MNALKKPLGPLPVYGWILAVSAGVLIFYWQRRNAGVTAGGGGLAPQPILDPTQGAFPMPSGLSSGGAGPSADPVYPSLGQELTDITTLAGGLGQLYATMPFAPAAALQEPPSSGASAPGGTGVADVLSIVGQLRDAGLIAPAATSAGAAASAPASHAKKAPAAKRVNADAGSKREGKTYRIVNDPKGHPRGRYHVYGSGRAAKYVRVSK